MLVDKFIEFLEEYNKSLYCSHEIRNNVLEIEESVISVDKLEEFLRRLIYVRGIEKGRRIAGHGDKPDTPRPKPAPRPQKRGG